MELLERKTHLDEIAGLLKQAAAGHGRLLFLGGEAGVGKSTLVRAVASAVPVPVRVLHGACDPISTPRPHGPLLDMCDQMSSTVASLVHSPASRSELFKAVLNDLETAGTTLMIVEDAHWADEGTLDLIRYLGRRVGSTHALLLVTFRDDEVGATHSLRRVLGELATAEPVRRLALRPLSASSVAQLARNSSLDPVKLHEQTGGNPFFVTELLALNEPGLPATVRDAVLARASRLSQASKDIVNACAIIGSPIEPWLLEDIIAPGDAVAEAIDRGILIPAGSTLAFRHELARTAILEAIPPTSARWLHEQTLAALRSAPAADLARLAHHADAAGNIQAVLDYAPAAAERAAALGAHREAAAQYDRVLQFSDQLPPEQHAEFLEARSYECYLTDQVAEAIDACEQALEIWQSLGNGLREGDARRKLARLFWVDGRNLESEIASRKAIETLEQFPPGAELAKAYSGQAQLRVLAWDSEEAIAWGEKAIAVAERAGETPTLVHALNNVGSARSMTETEQGKRELERSLELALQHGLDDDVARAYAVLGCNHCRMFLFLQADIYLIEGIEFCADHDLEFMRLYISGWRGMSLMYQGQWEPARRIAESVLASSRQSPLSRIVALTALGRLQSRQGHPDAWKTLDQALELALPTGELQRLVPIRTARAEAAWLRGDSETSLAEANDLYEQTARAGYDRQAGELAFWRWRAGQSGETSFVVFDPFARQIAGNWREAAARWRALGCPYEAASALADSDDASDLRYALAEFQKLGAAPMASQVGKRVRELAAAKSGRRQKPRSYLPLSRPQTRYARSGDVNIAYQVIGDGPLDLVFVMGWVSNIEYFWRGPAARFLTRLASFSRLIVFDKRGTGLSDRVAELPTIEQRMDDVRAVMDAAGSERAVLFGISEGAAMCSVFAATYPGKTTALVIYGGYAKRIWSPDYPWAPTALERQAFYEAIEHGWGGAINLDMLAPSAAGDSEFREWWAGYLRQSASPGAALELARMKTDIDIDSVLPVIRVPTLIVHRTGDLDSHIGGARYLAERIPGATYVELPGNDHLVFAGDQDAVLDEVEHFLTGATPGHDEDRVLATIASIAITDAAERAVLLGERQWQIVLASFRQACGQALSQFRGNVIQQSPTGLLAAFDGPVRATRWASSIAGWAAGENVPVRAGLHAGECELAGEDVSGIPLQIAARIMSLAEPGQLLASSTVKDLTAGSGIAFAEVSARLGDDLSSEWRLFEVERGALPGALTLAPATAAIEPPVGEMSPLSRREREIAVLIVNGLSNRQIAAELSISPATAERHVSNIFNKLGFHSRAQIAAWAVKQHVES